jgi:two-component system, NarL family, sensor histidine kinase DegS
MIAGGARDEYDAGMTPVRRLTLGYVIALAAIGVLLVSVNVVVEHHLDGHAHDSRLVNVAGRQRMLSQRITALALALSHEALIHDPLSHDEHARGAARRDEVLDDLAKAADEWERSQRALREDFDLIGSTATPVAAMYAQIEDHYRTMLDACRRILKDPDDRAEPTRVILAHGEQFLAGMEAIVHEYDRDARVRVQRLARLERVILTATLAVLVLEGFLVFRPLVRGVRRAIRRLEKAQQALEASLREQHRLEERLIDAADNERRALGEDLHDGICQHIVGVSYMLRALRGKVEGAQGERVTEAAALLEDAVEQLRRLAKGLHPVGVEMHGLPSALAQLGETIACAYRIPCDVTCAGAEDVPMSARIQLFRIAQEALSNAAKHASATHIEVIVREAGGVLALEIVDDGVGISDAPRDGMGLHTMRSRANMIGAELELSKIEGGGTVVRCTLPLEPPSSQESRIAS